MRKAATTLVAVLLAAVAAAAWGRCLWRRGALDGFCAWWHGASKAARGQIVRKSYLGATPTAESHQRNDSPTGTSGIYLSSFRDSFGNAYMSYLDDRMDNKTDINNDRANVPLPFEKSFLSKYLSNLAVHEFAHAAGLVPAASAAGHGHNRCSCGSHIMDSGKTRRALVYLGYVRYLELGWNLENMAYLKFVFPY